MKKLLSALLSICFLLSSFTIYSFAEKKENLCQTFRDELYSFPDTTGEYIRTEDFLWQRPDRIDIKEGEVFLAEVVIDYATIRYAFENYPKNVDEETDIYTVPEEEFIEFCKKHFDKINTNELREVTYIDNSGDEVLNSTYFVDGNYVFKGPLNGAYNTVWHIAGYYDLGDDFYEIYAFFADLEATMSDFIAKTRVSYIDNNIKFYSFEKTDFIPDDLITYDTIIEEENSSVDSETSEKEDSTESQETSSDSSTSLISSSFDDSTTSEEPQTSTVSKDSGSNTSSKKPQGNTSSNSQSKNNSSKTQLTNSSKSSQTNNSSKVSHANNSSKNSGTNTSSKFVQENTSSNVSKANTSSKNNQTYTSSKVSHTNSVSKNEDLNSSYENNEISSNNADSVLDTVSTKDSADTTSNIDSSNDESDEISVSLGSEINDSSDDVSSEISTDEVKSFAEIEGVKIEGKTSVFPQNTVVEILELTEGDTFKSIEKTIENKASKWKAFDISAKNNNISIQPSGTVILTLSIPEDFDLSLLEIWYISDNGEIEFIPSVVNNLEKTITAELSHFSAYVMVENAVTEEISFSSNNNKDEKQENETEKGNKIIWIIISVVVVLLIAGVCVWYFLFFKKKQNAN